jgi:uncharacterized membrane protein
LNVKKRGHFEIKFTAAFMRLIAILLVISGLLAGLALTQFQTQASTFTGLPGGFGFSGIAYVVAVVTTLVYAIILWGFADALVLIADTNDAQRVTAAQVAQLMGERGDRGDPGEPRVSLMTPVSSSDVTERLPPTNR